MNPVTPQTQKAVRAAVYDLSVTRQLIDQAKAAGIPCDEEDSRCKHLTETLLSFEQAYCRDCKPSSSK